MQLTHLKYMFPLFLVYLQICTAISHHSQFQNLFIPQKEAPYLLEVPPSLSRILVLGHHQSTLCLYKFAYSGHFMQVELNNMSVCALLCPASFTQQIFSVFIHVTACINHSFLLPNNILLYRYTKFYLSMHWLMDMWVAPTFWLLRIMMLSIFLHKFLCGRRFSFLLVYIQQQNYWVICKSMFSIWKNCQIASQSSCTVLCSH